MPVPTAKVITAGSTPPTLAGLKKNVSQADDGGDKRLTTRARLLAAPSQAAVRAMSVG